MIIDWFKFTPALVLLLTPIGLFYGRRIRYRDISCDLGDYLTRILTVGLHTIDLGRAALGAWLLIDSLHSSPDARGLARYSVWLTLGGVRVVAIFLQTVVCKERDSANAPFAFVAGMLLGGFSPLGVVFSLLLTATLAMGLRSPIAFFPLLGIIHVAIGLLFSGKGLVLNAALVLNLTFAACPLMVPWLWSLLFHRPLVIAYRSKHSVESEDSDSPLR